MWICGSGVARKHLHSRVVTGHNTALSPPPGTFYSTQRLASGERARNTNKRESDTWTADYEQNPRCFTYILTPLDATSKYSTSSTASPSLLPAFVLSTCSSLANLTERTPHSNPAIVQASVSSPPRKERNKQTPLDSYSDSYSDYYSKLISPSPSSLFLASLFFSSPSFTVTAFSACISV